MTKNNFAKIIPEFRKYKKWTKIYLLITFLVILILAGILTFVKIQTKNNIGLQIPLVILIVILVIVFINLSYILLKTFILNKKGYYIASFRVISTLFLTKSMYHDVFNDITDNFKDDWLPPRTNGNPLLIVFYLSVPIFLIEEGKDASKDEWYSFIKFMLFTIWYWVFCWISGVVLLFIRFICHWKLRVNDQKIKKILESE